MTLFALRHRYGEIESIRVLHERFCAFVNFKNANMAALAMEKLNVSTSLVKGVICSCFLLLISNTTVKMAPPPRVNKAERAVVE